ncbi:MULTISPECIES: extracellular catalytic domain type 1 short-chain-length polyhydroxyalkanoate depolymerase [Streptomyces]|uniref:extracellular catalytic domain type 1 short-chain-length polyhydroxyalkanoate depolymerase n=1 Tax=Streptomyces TaxID=1883 RepID=UPI00073E0174|nr:PHB depolymerase family esterase [Streptomyces sp. EAS-AB2608]MYU27423.1 PHB depolymerase family esterase [Streptomyces sp. SID7810]BCM72380.1 putative polyhydroxybutyrate depolymerase [Streptomyces sp. EAS-AB2608]CUW26274.1 Esterase PHB depolymerase [Streptomyces reticuli]
MPSPSTSTAPGAPPGARLLLRLLAVLAVVLGTALAGPAPEARAAVTLTRVTGFGTNPGALTMYVYRPATLPAHPPVVVALHGCTQNAQVYADHSGLPQLADRAGFLLVLAETGTANNASKCFNWFQAGDNRRGQGEALSVRQMVSHAVTAHGADPRRVYVTGLSAGGAMTAVMLAAYPDVFSAGAVVAGLPYDCTRDSSPYTCMNPGVDRSPADWAQRVRDAHPSYTGPWPRTAIWYGDQDTTVVPRNATELRDQWTAVHGLPQTPTRTTTIGPNGTRQEQYLAADGTVAVEVDRVPGIGHGTPVDPGTGAEQCGSTGAPYFLDSICSSLWIARFFGLDTTGPGDPGPGDPDPGGGAACWTASNYAHVQAGRATTSGGYTYATGSGQNMGLYNTFVTHTLKESPTGYFTLADAGCP